jgi:hypothetical protein
MRQEDLDDDERDAELADDDAEQAREDRLREYAPPSAELYYLTPDGRPDLSRPVRCEPLEREF